MPTAIPMITPVPILELLLGSGVDVPVEVCDAAVPVSLPVLVGVFVTTETICVIWPGVNVTSDTTADVWPEAGACVTVTTTAEVPAAVGAVTVWTMVDALAVMTLVRVLATLLMPVDDDDAEPEPAAAFHFANVNAMGVPESPQFLDIVL
jgi:hypothetical protein